jgi:hypothetical protein
VVCSRDQRGPRRGIKLRWLLLRQRYLGCSMKIFMAARAGDTVVLCSYLTSRQQHRKSFLLLFQNLSRTCHCFQCEIINDNLAVPLSGCYSLSVGNNNPGLFCFSTPRSLYYHITPPSENFESGLRTPNRKSFFIQVSPTIVATLPAVMSNVRSLA